MKPEKNKFHAKQSVKYTIIRLHSSLVKFIINMTTITITWGNYHKFTLREAWCCKNHNERTCGKASGREPSLSSRSRCTILPAVSLTLESRSIAESRMHAMYGQCNKKKPDSARCTQVEVSLQPTVHPASQSTPANRF